MIVRILSFLVLLAAIAVYLDIEIQPKVVPPPAEPMMKHTNWALERKEKVLTVERQKGVPDALCYCKLTLELVKQNKFFYFHKGDYRVMIGESLRNRGWIEILPCHGCDIDFNELSKFADLLWVHFGEQVVYEYLKEGAWVSKFKNHEIVRKDNLGRILKNFWYRYGEDYISPVTYELEVQSEYAHFLDLLAKRATGESDQLYIVKPVGASGGRGVTVIDSAERFSDTFLEGNDPSQQSNLEDHIAQEYLDPFLWGGKKFDMRTYLFIPSTKPLMAFYHRGYFRVNIGNFSLDNITDVHSHITNINQQKKHPGWEEFEHQSRRSFEELQEYLTSSNLVDSPDYVNKTMEPEMVRRLGMLVDAVAPRYKNLEHDDKMFAFLGVDFILDSKKNPLLIEITNGPAGHKGDKLKFFPNMMEEMLEMLTEIRFRKEQGLSLDSLDSRQTWVRIPLGSQPRITARQYANKVVDDAFFFKEYLERKIPKMVAQFME